MRLRMRPCVRMDAWVGKWVGLGWVYLGLYLTHIEIFNSEDIMSNQEIENARHTSTPLPPNPFGIGLPRLVLAHEE